MSKKINTKSLDVQAAYSILYYDEQEINAFFNMYDSLQTNLNSVVSGMFNLFIDYIRKFKDFSEDGEAKKEKIKKFILIKNSQNPNKEKRENFELWFEKVLEVDIPLELTDDLCNRFLWEELMNSMHLIDKSDIPFSEKLNIRPQLPKFVGKEEGLIFLDDIEMQEENDITPYTTGLEDLDDIVKFEKTNFVVIAARPSVGKSLVMLLMAIANARQGVKTLFLSLEMNVHSLDSRILNHYTGENLKEQHKDEDGKLDFMAYKKACLDIKKQKSYKGIKDNLQLLVSKSGSADHILTKIEDAINEGGYEAIFIDYLQLLKFNNKDEWTSIRLLTNALKNLAFRTDTLIVTGSQVSRTSTERGLYLSDLFGSSTIEADTDIVIGLENPRERRRGEEGVINLKILKNREGDLGEIKYRVDYSTGRLRLTE